MEEAYEVLLIGAMIFLAVATAFCILRTIIGPRFTDRIVAVNMVSTKVTLIICILSVMKGENYLVDVALTYAMAGGLAIVVLSKVYLHSYKKRKKAMGGEQKNV